jgi:hypothetical protein
MCRLLARVVGATRAAVGQVKYQRYLVDDMADTTDTTIINPGEHAAEELLAGLKNGERFVVRTEVLGSTEELTLRYDGEIFYCDSPTILHKHTEEAEMLECIEGLGFTR